MKYFVEKKIFELSLREVRMLPFAIALLYRACWLHKSQIGVVGVPFLDTILVAPPLFPLHVFLRFISLDSSHFHLFFIVSNNRLWSFSFNYCQPYFWNISFYNLTPLLLWDSTYIELCKSRGPVKVVSDDLHRYFDKFWQVNDKVFWGMSGIF